MSDSVKAINKCKEIERQIELEGDLITLPNGIKTKNPLYEILKIWHSRKIESLVALGLTPYARKRISGTAETDSISFSGRKPTHKKTLEEQIEEDTKEFL